MTPESVLREYFGYSSFREGQRELIGQILRGGDVLGIMPTGAGKSVCYQVPSMLLPGMTVVVSPLISLMADQTESLREAGIPAVCLHGNLSQEEYFAAASAVRRGEIRLLYTAPERLLTEGFLSLIRKREISMVAVDEAHCLSQWGQDFRPQYLAIADFLQMLPHRPVTAAFTATATEDVRADIRRLLGLRAPLELVTGFDRPNLYYAVEQPANKDTALRRILQKHEGESGIVYCISRNQTDAVCRSLNAAGIRTGRYHAGMTPEERRESQEAFLHDRVTVMAATNAFGMGIDKSNVSFVVHYNMPKSMEAYYQEAGRAGRDGSPAECILLYSPQDIRTNRFLIDGNDTENERMTPEQQEAVRRMDYRRLDEMIRYCSGTECLRAFILRYFGEQAPPRCGSCGNCSKYTEKKDVTEEAQKILSCVYRMKRRGLHGTARFVCDILRGKETKQTVACHCEELSTYGLMRDIPQKQIEDLIGILLARGYLKRVADSYGSLELTAQANPVLRGQERVEAAMPKAEPKHRKVSVPAEDAGPDEVNFQLLRRVREKLALRRGVPAYIILSDAALRDICRKRPKTKEELLTVSGIGKNKAEKYGAAFLAAVAEFI